MKLVLTRALAGIVLILSANVSDSLASGGAAVLHAAGETSRYDLAPYIFYLEDKDSAYTLQDVKDGPLAKDFRPLDKPAPLFTSTPSAYWYRLEIENRTQDAREFILEEEIAWINNLTLYRPGPEGKYESFSTGVDYPVWQREIPHRSYLFNIRLAPGESQTLYLRAKTNETFLTPLILWTPEAFQEVDTKRAYYFGALYGVLMVMLVYNTLLFVFTRDRLYVYYAAYLLCGLFFSLSFNGFGYLLLWPGQQWYADVATHFWALSFMVSAILFTRVFLETKRNLPKVDKVLLVLGWFIAIQFFPDLAGVYHWVFNIVSDILFLLLWPVLAAIGIYAFFIGVRSARFFLLAWLAGSAGMFTGMSSAIGIFDYSFALMRGGEIGTLLDVCLLSVALADKINFLKMEKSKADKQAQEALQKSNEELERQVALRVKELEIAKDQAEEATKLKDNFVSLVSHDIRAPLSIISAFAGLVDLESKDQKEIEQNKMLVERMRKSATNLVELVDQLLDISRLQTGNIKLEKRPTKALPFMGIWISHLEPLAVENDIAIKYDIPGDAELFVDQELFGQVVKNLVTNAIKFCKAGDLITISLDGDVRSVLEVRDTGAGISAAILPELFRHETKTTTQGVRGEKGFGLGLPYSCDIVKAHGGKITVSSSPGEGSVFRIEIPRMDHDEFMQNS